MSESNTPRRVRASGPLGPVELARCWTPEKWKKLSKKDRRHVYMAHADLQYFVLKVFLPFQSPNEGCDAPDHLPSYQEELCHKLQYELPNTEQMLVLVAVGFFKTTLAVKAYCLWLIGNNPELSFLLATDQIDNASRYLLEIQKHIEDNEDYRFVFGDLYPGSRGQRAKHVKWSSKEMTVRRQLVSDKVSFRAAGYGSRIAGRRYDIAICDDVVARMNSLTPNERESVHQFIIKDVRGRLVPENRRLLVIGSVFHYDDAHCRFRSDAAQRKTWVVHEYPALEDDSVWPPPLPPGCSDWTPDIADELDYSGVKSIWPEWWTPRRLYLDWVSDKSTFAATRMLKPINPEDQKFPLALLTIACRANGRVFMGIPIPALSCWSAKEGAPQSGSRLYQQYMLAGVDLPTMNRVISIDPALGKSVKSREQRRSFCVLQLWGQDINSRRILLDMERMESAPPKLFKQVFEEWLHAYYDDDLTTVVYEGNAMQQYIAIDLQDTFDIHIRKRELKVNKLEDIERIRELVDDGKLLYPYADDYSIRKVAPFEEELSQYPISASIDTIVAAAHAMAIMGPTFSSRGRSYLFTEENIDVPLTSEMIDEGAPPGESMGLIERMNAMMSVDEEYVDPMVRIKRDALRKARRAHNAWAPQ